MMAGLIFWEGSNGVRRGGHNVEKANSAKRLERIMQQRKDKIAYSIGRGESQEVLAMDVEVRAGKRGCESLAGSEWLLEEVLDRENLKKALKRVVANDGAPGIDGMTVKELPEYLKVYWLAIKEKLLAQTYKAKPVRRVEIPKPDGGVRKLGIPCAVDRFIQQALLQVLQKYWDPTFSEKSFGFRPGKNAHQAVSVAQLHVKRGASWVVDVDLASFFDRVNHDRLMMKVKERVKDERIVRLIQSYLRAGVMEGGLVKPSTEGTPQGGPLSPLLSNLVLDELDREMTRRGHRYVRYADDANVYVRSKKAGERVMISMTKFITGTLKLKVNEDKSAVDRPWNRKFLGFSITTQGRRRIAAKALKRFQDKVRQITRRSGGWSLKQVVSKLKPYLIGWNQYFGFAQLKTDFDHLNSWIKRKLRCIIWKQWGSFGTRYRELKRRGIKTQTAWVTSKSGHGPWRISRSPAMHQLFGVRFFSALGLPSLARAA